MGLHEMLLQLSLLWAILATTAATNATAQAKHGCPASCGNLSIPYPFGTQNGCCLDDNFLITCTEDNKPFLRAGNISVLNISLEGQIRVLASVAKDCYDLSGKRASNNQSLSVAEFPVSYTRNKLTAVGCDTIAVIQGHKYTTGCMSVCGEIDDVVNGSCSGIGCCQTSIPRGIMDFNVSVSSYNNHKGILDFSRCSYAFVVEEEQFDFSSVDLYDLRKIEQFPVVLDWTIGIEGCEEARKKPTYVCGEHSKCVYVPDDGPGYRCNCSQGFQGNPYLPNGCEDINECGDTSLNQCTHICNNTVGSYSCSCPSGYHGDGRKDGIGCIADSLWIKAIVGGVGIGLIVLFVIIPCIYLGVRKKNISKLRQNFFEKNGGIMLQQLLSKREGSFGKAKIFTEEELKKATNNFDESRVIGQGGCGTVYKGILADNGVVAIKKSKVVDRDQIEQFVNEVVILSQINHKNVVKLLGCCLETPVPLLVYEFITNQTLFHHIHNKGHISSLPWATRLRIAAETAGAIAHMHFDAPMQIIHRDIKSANILLDDEYTAKVSDFGVSRLVPLDQTQLSTLVQGTFGYIDPEYFHSGLLTEKSDVYSFGVVLVELLTGKNVFSLKRLENERNLATHFISSLKEDRLFEVLDGQVKREGHVEQLKEVAELAKNCLRLKRQKRPTMKEVERELEELMRHEKNTQVEFKQNLEEEEPLLNEPFNFCGGSTSAASDSLKSQVISPLNTGR